MLVSTTCPNCGAQLTVDDSKEQLYCTYCGTKIVNMAQKIEVNQTIQQNVVHSGKVEYKIDHSSDPTLNIQYSTINPQVKMIVVIASTRQKSVFVNGQNMSFRLAPGKHDLVLKIGKINYKRTVYVPDDFTPVTVYASFDGRARITIDQPNYTIPQTPDANRTSTASPDAAVRNNANRPKPSWMSILGFILSLTFYLSPAGLVFCIIDMIKNKGERPKGLTIAGIIISAVMIFVLILVLITGVIGNGNTGA